MTMTEGYATVEGEAQWTVKDNDGLTHRAVRQCPATPMFVITMCPWWHTHNMSGERAPVRIDQTVTCLACVRLELEKLRG